MATEPVMLIADEWSGDMTQVASVDYEDAGVLCVQDKNRHTQNPYPQEYFFPDVIWQRDEIPQPNELWYTTTDGQPITIPDYPNKYFFGYHVNNINYVRHIVSNTYENGRGVIKLDGVYNKIVTIKTSIDSSSTHWLMEGQTTLKSLTFPLFIPTMETINKGDCVNLDTVTFWGTMRNLADIFGGSEAVTNFNIPHYITGYSNLFFGCKNIKEIQHTGPDFIDNGAYNGSGVVYIDVPENVKTIKSKAFYNCADAVRITIPASVTSITSDSFELANVKTITVDPANEVYKDGGNNYITEKATGRLVKGCDATVIDSTVIAIGDNAFEHCEFESISIPDTVTLIGQKAFSRCLSLASLHIPDSVAEIGPNAFYGCTALAYINIPDAVVKISQYTFWGCTALTSISIPNGVTSLGISAFGSCTSLENVNIPSGISELPSNVFSGCTALTTISIPDGITSIGSRVFEKTGITGLTVPDSVTSMSTSALSNMPNVKKIVIGDGMKAIPSNTFVNNNNMESVTIGSSVESIASGAFTVGYSNKLVEIIAKPTKAPTINSTVFSQIKNNNGVLKIPAGSDYSSWTDKLTTWTVEEF